MIIQDENLELRFLSEIFMLKDRGKEFHWDDTRLLRALELSIKLIKVLASIHDLGVVHGSLRPNTISESLFSEVHVHDLSAAFHIDKDLEILPIRERGMHEESLHYLAPECTGRISKSVDYRSDYYAVGATLFEIFTGHPPFADTVDPLDTIHAHIARRPPAINAIDDTIPQPLALIVAKLLEKSPEARYQTSQGLIGDLERVASLVRQRGKGDSTQMQGMDFTVGAVDSAAHFQLPAAWRMYGRDEPVKQLVTSYERVKAKTEADIKQNEVVVVKGTSGVGKSTLVEPLRKSLAQAKGFYTSVKFGMSRTNILSYIGIC